MTTGPCIDDLTVYRRDEEALEVWSALTRGRCATVFKFSFSPRYSVQPFLIPSYMQGISHGLILAAVERFVDAESRQQASAGVSRPVTYRDLAG